MNFVFGGSFRGGRPGPKFIAQSLFDNASFHRALVILNPVENFAIKDSDDSQRCLIAMCMHRMRARPMVDTESIHRMQAQTPVLS